MIALLSYGVVHNAVLFKIVVVVLFKVLIKHVLGVCRVCGGASDAMPLQPKPKLPCVRSPVELELWRRRRHVST